ncbi:DUF222 domain-containing protein [Gordonia sp. (in: high G+C Gram-positive bacteria)]|uniref:DUF222 domain-containing protein n=1 Tax=Gordonia sp. (in: high G+C Gram-positive bacteria) TaxID=84139 RepID=UPI0039E5156A
MLSSALPESPLALARLIDAAEQRLASAPLGLLTDDEVQATVETLETARRRRDGVDAALYVEVNDRQVFLRTGHTKPRDFYAQHLRLGAAVARQREDTAAAIGRLTAMTGEKLPPKREEAAVAVAAGEISGHHVREIEKVMDKIPQAADIEDAEMALTMMTTAASDLMPDEIGKVGQRILAHLDPDGSLTDDVDRKRQRGITIGRQDSRLMSSISGYLTPQLRAKLEVLLDNLAKPGMNNPDDEDCLRGPASELGADDREALADAAARDRRTAAQRNHDAIEAGLDWLLGHESLGRPDRLPAQLVITVDEGDLARRAGVALTATGTMLPVTGLVELAADATPWLEVFRSGTRQVLDLYRGARIATKAQRLALFGAHHGCTRPMCTRPASQCQVHHAELDWAKGGMTNLNDLTLACGPDNRNVGDRPGQWETTVLTTGPDAGRTGWRLVGSTGPYRTNPIHRRVVLARTDDATADDPPKPRPAPPMRRAMPETWEPEYRPSPVEAALEARLAAAS